MEHYNTIHVIEDTPSLIIRDMYLFFVSIVIPELRYVVLVLGKRRPGYWVQLYLATENDKTSFSL